MHAIAKPTYELNRHQRAMSQADVDALCATAKSAWREAGPRKRTLTFRWRGRLYKSRWTNLRLLVDTIDGDPMVCIWGA
jgi:hypothetical protein